MKSSTYLVAFVLSALMATPAMADGDWITGVYGDEAGCAVHNGGTPTTDNLIIVQVDEIRRFESVCPITNITEQGNQTVLDVQCASEGETFAAQYIVEDAAGDSFVISLTGTGYRATIRPCG